MNSTQTMSYPSLYEFMRAHRAESGSRITHTRIGNKEMNVFPGKFSIPDEKKSTFYKLYFKWVFEQKKYEYLTEVQDQINGGPILVDLDFRYETNITERQHTADHIRDLVNLYLRKLQELFCVPQISNGDKFPVFVLEKPSVNITDSVTKDGIHIIIGLHLTHSQQMLLRKHVLNEIEFVLGELPLKNDYESVLDDCISKGHTNWQMFGSRKPNHETYSITHYFMASYHDDEDIDLETKPTIDNNLRLKKIFPKLSAHYDKYQQVATRERYQEDLNTIEVKAPRKTSAGNAPQNSSFTIESVQQLREEVEHFLETIPPEQYEVTEMYHLVMALPEKYSDEYPFWIRVGWALHNMDHSKSMFLVWMLFSAKSAKFSIDDIAENYERWTRMYATWVGGKRGARSETAVDNSGNIVQNENETNGEGLNIVTKATIIYWVRKENPEEYKRIKNNTINHLIENSCNGFNEVDIAKILKHMYGDKYACVAIKNQQWYEFKGHRWHEIDCGYSLRDKISNKVARLYMDKVGEYMDVLSKLSDDDENLKKSFEKKVQKMSEIHIMLKRTNHVTNIMKEACYKFYDKNFYSQLDNNPYLLCCRNGVLDFRVHEFRPGKPEDYLSLCTNIDYIPMVEFDKEQELAKEKIIGFMEQLFPENDLNRYIWDHLSSTLLGTNDNQTFNIYTGSGCNGKSKMVDLMGMVLGDYKGTVPITLVTRQRTSIGNASPEIIQLKGKRYAVMQEPSKGEQINEGVMKELTGGDPIQGRALFKDTVTFNPQFKLAVCTNNLFDIKSNDDGTWRRIRVCDFKSKFTEKPYEDFPEEEYPFQFPINKRLDEQFKYWKEVFLALLVERVKTTDGIVKDCEHVLVASNKYREGQDCFAEFIKERVHKDEHSFIKKKEIYEEFKIWYQEAFGNKNAPKRKEMEEYLNKKLGHAKAHGWDGWRYDYEAS